MQVKLLKSSLACKSFYNVYDNCMSILLKFFIAIVVLMASSNHQKLL